MTDKPIIVIDDDQDDLDLVLQLFQELKLPNELLSFTDGAKFLEYMANSTIQPLFILCDINMAQMDGLELKRRIFEDESLRMKCIPFVFWSTSGASPHVVEAYSYNVQGYFIKPNSMQQMMELIQCIKTYWTYSKHPNSPKQQ